jgi:hypothetical protein
MYTNVNLAAPVGVLTFLGTAFLLGVIALIVLHALIRRKIGRATLFVVAGVVIASVYFGIVLLFSFASNERVLTRGQEKHFCEIDCHLAYSIVGVDEPKVFGSPASSLTAAGLFHVIRIKTRFDETTISPTRGDGLLYPNPRRLTVMDDQGRRYFPAEDAQRVLEQSAEAGTAITTPRRPGESYTTTVAFDLPWDIKNPTLLINESDWVTHFIIGHENSPLHKKTRFQL